MTQGNMSLRAKRGNLIGQIPDPDFQAHDCLGHWYFEIWYCLGFGAWDLGFAAKRLWSWYYR